MKLLLLIVKIALIPFSLLYALVTEVRNFLFDWHLLPVFRSKIPVVSVGNIRVGGTGKTPFTIWLAQRLSEHSVRVAIVSRGYRRKSKGLKLVAEAGKIVSDVQDAGDEPLLMAHKVPQALIIVSEKRKKALHHIELTEAADVVILDDAFQHRWVARNADIVLLHSAGFWDNWPLPTGRLRETIWQLKRATYLLRRPDKAGGKPITFVPQHRQFEIEFVPGKIVNEYFEPLGSLEEWRGKPAIAFAGIARPQAFFSMLKRKGIKLLASERFTDHYRYKESDLQRLLHLCRATEARWLFCTEKDLVKIREFLPVLEAEIKIAGVHLVALSLEVRLQDEQNFLNDLVKRLTI